MHASTWISLFSYAGTVLVVCSFTLPYQLEMPSIQHVPQTRALQRHHIVEQGTIKIVFGGDVSFDSPIRLDNGSNCSYAPLMANIKKYLDEADYSMVNLEAPFVTRDMANGTFLPGKGIHNKAWAESVEALVAGGVDGVTLANNHLLDYGDEAVALTSNILSNNSIDSVGVSEGGFNYSSQIPIIKTIKGIRVGILGYCFLKECTLYRPGFSLGQAIYSRATLQRDVSALKSIVDIIIVFIHWGTEYMTIPNEDDRDEAVYMVEQGVHLIIGSHPHVLQGHEYINSTLVKYSLGNLVFHAHFTYMGELAGNPKAKEIHARYIELSKHARGPAGRTELFLVHLNKERVVRAELLPVRVKVDKDTGCLYPTAHEEDAWIDVCGEVDEDCYSPRPQEEHLSEDMFFYRKKFTHT